MPAARGGRFLRFQGWVLLSLSPQFLDELRARTSLSALVGASVKLTKAGREHKGCCPFHNEKTASFYVNDDKGFYHCFGCSAHGDAIRWLTERQGLGFIDAVKDLADRAGLEVPAASPEYREREERIERAGGVLEAAADWYAKRLASDAPLAANAAARAERDGAIAMLADRGVGAAAIARFGLGLAPRMGGVAATLVGNGGRSVDELAAVGLLVESDNGWVDFFRQRLMIPIHDARGRVIGFGGRATSDRQQAKYKNSAEGPHFDKGRTLYNLHRAAPAAREARRLVIVEGYFDAIALDGVGVTEVVAPMGTALTEAQLERAWRVCECPVLLLDGDKAGRGAALRACERAMPMLGTTMAGAGGGASLSVALLPDGMDPDDLARAEGREGVERVLSAAMPLSDFVFDAVVGVAA